MTTKLLSTLRSGTVFRPCQQSFADGWNWFSCQTEKGMGAFASLSKPKARPHVKSRCLIYPGSSVKRFPVPDDKVSWDRDFPAYKPVEYTTQKVMSAPWADEDVRTTGRTLLWNSVDGNVDRRSHIGLYKIVDNCPRNPMGRTGVTGRGRLGRWGPNHAADPVVTRWKRDSNGRVVEKGGRRVAQFVAIQRKDSREWAIPGGMVDPGETVTETLMREFGEEALDTLGVPDCKKENINQLFQNGVEIFRGYVDDPRNTDNAWMETVVMNFHDEDGKSVGAIHLKAGDDAVGVQWMDLDRNLSLFASHTDFLRTAARTLNASW